MPSPEPSPPFHQQRSAAILLVGISGIILFFLSLVLQVLAWELRPFLELRFEGGMELPGLTKVFIDVFGYRPDSYLMLVTWWFWWPMVGSFFYCHIRHIEPRDFARAFMFAFVLSWLVFMLFVSIILFLFSMSFVILLAEFHEPPSIASVIMPISWAIPIVLAITLSIYAWRRKRASTP